MLRVKPGPLRIGHTIVATKRVPPRPEAYNVVQGWRYENQTYKGDFVVNGRRYPGELWRHYGKICGRVASLPPAVKSGRHAACFSADHERSGWWRIHFADMPTTIDGAILAIEQSIRESL